MPRPVGPAPAPPPVTARLRVGRTSGQWNSACVPAARDVITA